MFIFVQLILKKLSGYCLLFAAAALLSGCFSEVDLTEEEQQLNDRLSQPGQLAAGSVQPLAITLAAARRQKAILSGHNSYYLPSH